MLLAHPPQSGHREAPDTTCHKAALPPASRAGTCPTPLSLPGAPAAGLSQTSRPTGASPASTAARGARRSYQDGLRHVLGSPRPQRGSPRGGEKRPPPGPAAPPWGGPVGNGRQRAPTDTRTPAGGGRWPEPAGTHRQRGAALPWKRAGGSTRRREPRRK